MIKNNDLQLVRYKVVIKRIINQLNSHFSYKVRIQEYKKK